MGVLPFLLWVVDIDAQLADNLDGDVMRYYFILILFILAGLQVGCSEEQQNKLSRLGVTWLEGDYKVTFVEGSHVKTWRVNGGKVTTEPQKGYYYFWADNNGKKVYVQTPILRTYIEEIK